MLLRLHCDDGGRCGGTGDEGGECVAQGAATRVAFVRMTVMEVNELAEIIDVLDRVLQRRLPAGKQHDDEKEST